ncbi:MAG: hypothetical protein ACLQVN_13565 [Bryobacteraceae bacterium]
MSSRLGNAAVQVRAVLGTVGETLCLDDSEHGTSLILLVTNPSGRRVRITGCYGERKTGWRGRRRERFSIAMHGLPHDFAVDGNRCLAWTETAALPNMAGLARLYVEDSDGAEWPVEDEQRLKLIVDRLT